MEMRKDGSDLYDNLLDKLKQPRFSCHAESIEQKSRRTPDTISNQNLPNDEMQLCESFCSL
jgi:hypothetical protein